MSTMTEPNTVVKKILVVEDERIIAINICSTLKQYGYLAQYVSEANEAIEEIENGNFDLVLMDIMLNGDMDGIEIASIIKKTKAIPVIYLTAYSDEATINRAKTTEPFGYLVKPFNSRDLYISVEMAIYKSQVQKHIKDVEGRLAENQKWETIGLVASGISHEVNNPLTSILNLSELIKLEAKKMGNTPIVERSVKIAEETERIAKIVKNLVSYSQSTSSQWTYCNLGIILTDTRSFLHQYFLKEGIQCEMNLADVPLLYCQPQKIKQAFLNLLQDARMRVNTRGDSIGRKIEVNLEPSDLNGDKQVAIQIKDNGEEDLMLGIAQFNSMEVTKRIISEHKGTIVRDDDKSSWYLTLPVVNAV
ncbi:response regulator [Leptospira sp. 96542]|nr:response regulator [Leptospira sp. 96542]